MTKVLFLDMHFAQFKVGIHVVTCRDHSGLYRIVIGLITIYSTISAYHH